MTSIAHRCNLILSSLRSIAQSTHIDDAATTSKVKDELARFSLWAGNLGALHQPKSSLSVESRLVDAPEVLLHVAELLEDLNEVARELSSISTGEREAKIDVPPDQELAEEGYVEITFGVEVHHRRPGNDVAPQYFHALNEEVELRKEIGACITRLFRITSLSVGL
jgi:hypothetical protein